MSETEQTEEPRIGKKNALFAKVADMTANFRYVEIPPDWQEKIEQTVIQDARAQLPTIVEDLVSKTRNKSLMARQELIINFYSPLAIAATIFFLIIGIVFAVTTASIFAGSVFLFASIVSFLFYRLLKASRSTRS
jgi:ABC-type multidrug transport system permease subunit